MIPVLPRDINVPPSVLKRRFAISSTRLPCRTRRRLERRGGISVNRSENGFFVRVVDPESAPARRRQLSQSDWLLLESLDTRCPRPLHTGRFLTMHKRRRKRLTTRSLLSEPALLDDIHHGQVQCILSHINQWPFNAFTLDNVTGGRPLPVLCVHLFHWYGLLEHFNLDVARCWKFFSLIEEGYHSSNPYHNAIHATDVTQAMHCFLQEKKIREHLSPLEIMAALIAAVTHDLDHPGVNQPFLIATSNHLAALYENTSVLENHHWRSAIGCLLESHVAEEIEDFRQELQEQISSLILATDITRQQEFLTRFKRYLDQDLLDMTRAADRHFILQIALKCADISNPCRPWDVSKKWSQKVCEEFFRQGDYERQLKLPVTALCDRYTTSVPKIQTGFFKFVVYPLFEEWRRFLGGGLATDLMRNLLGNQAQWEALVAAEDVEAARQAQRSCSPLSDRQESQSPDDEAHSLRSRSRSPSPATQAGAIGAGVQSRRGSQWLTIPGSENAQGISRVGRRHSVPLSLPSPTSPSVTVFRRESLPAGEVRQHRSFSPGLLEEDEEELLHGRSTLSLYSSTSVQDTQDRPVSAENLLPEPSIATITIDFEANRLSTVLQTLPPPPRQLTRQQTFPPLMQSGSQRQRNMSTCSEVLKENNRSVTTLVSASCLPWQEKREVDSSAPKMPKVDETVLRRLHGGEKENMCPSADEVVGRYSSRRNQVITSRRRGSAPAVGLPLREDKQFRRGSVPVGIALQNYQLETDEENNIRIVAAVTGNSAEIGLRTSNGKLRNRSCSNKLLRRRSSGGPEMFSSASQAQDTNSNWNRCSAVHVQENVAVGQRRGSLPIDVLLATYSGHHRTLEDS